MNTGIDDSCWNQLQWTVHVLGQLERELDVFHVIYNREYKHLYSRSTKGDKHKVVLSISYVNLSSFKAIKAKSILALGFPLGGVFPSPFGQKFIVQNKLM